MEEIKRGFLEIELYKQSQGLLNVRTLCKNKVLMDNPVGLSKPPGYLVFVRKLWSLES